ncbi:MAG: hypothetical protein LBT79_06390 [Elusimicrobiota bacterium]|jgi:predicted Zn-dependent protease with MMP-like domain|nr:hypothetical protein [Elusimicrobiota bacterium]
MPSLQIDNIPKELYNIISTMAVGKNISIEQETIFLLETAIDKSAIRAERLRRLFERIDRTNRNINNSGKLPDSAALVREDRDNR